MSDEMQSLRGMAATGLDLSPGDTVAAWAVSRIAQQDMTIAAQINREREWAARIARLEYENESIKRGQSQTALLTAMNEKHIERITAENQRLRAEIADRDQRISEIAFNCPSCGRHDFGLWQPTVKLKNENDLLKAALRWLSDNRVTLHHGVFFEGYVVHGETPIEVPPEFAAVIAEAVKS